MKNYLVTILICIFFLNSCSKNDESPSEALFPFDFNVECSDGVLVFDSPQDYEAAIGFLHSSSEIYGVFDNHFKFSSLYKSSTPEYIEENCDEIIGSILNSNSEFIISGKLFRIDFDSEMVSVLDFTEESSKKGLFTDFTFDDDVIDKVFTESSAEQDKKSIAATYCPSYDPGSVNKYPTPGTVRLRMQYLKLGVYYSVTGKIRKEFPEDYILVATTSPDNDEYGEFCYENNSTSGSIHASDTCISWLDNEAKIKPYSSMKRLKKYRFQVEYEIWEPDWDGYVGGWTQTHNCDCTDCDWL